VTALLTYDALSPLAAVGSRRYIEFGLLLALLVGVIRVFVGFAHAGVVAYMMSQPLLVGFVPAAAILIVASQIPLALGVRSRGRHELYRTGFAIMHVSDWQTDTILIAVLTSVVLLFGKRIHKLFPGVLVAVAAAILYSRFAGYQGSTLAGALHSSLPPLTTSLPLHEIPRLLVPALIISLLGFAEASSIARTYAAIDRRRWNANREFISQGTANIAAGLFGGFPVGASFSRSALNRLAGARTSASSLVTGLAVLAFLPLGFILQPLPQAVLAATVIVAVVPLIRLRRIVEVGKLSRVQLAVTLTAFGLTLVLAPHVELAILAAIGLSVFIHLWRELRLDLSVVSSGERLELIPQGVLWFGTSGVLEDRFVDALALHRATTQLVIRLDNLGRIDLSGALALKALIEDAERANLVVLVQGVPEHARKVLQRVLGDGCLRTHHLERSPQAVHDSVVVAQPDE
jgi:SulP family sulfate permease